MGAMRAARVGLLVQRFDAHLLHQHGHMLAANRMAFPPQQVLLPFRHLVRVNLVLLRDFGECLILS